MIGKSAHFILLSAVLAAFLVSMASSQWDACCPSLFGFCGDGSGGTPCCGRSPCNFWCCNCGRCHGRRKRDVSGVLEPTGFQRMDKDGNGHVDKEEAHLHLLSGGCGNYTEKVVDFEHNFKKYDKDGDGKLSYAEINTAH
ncbi:unnamed protein product [Orchesella dallaii]|uniref:EF-hand domain-containing protein n=1 Tax=Orchesella dallaii TaxID=48710 RepID=A0ABP1R8S1_9HEXA